MSLNINICCILHVATRNQKFDYEMNGVKLDSIQCVIDLGASIASNLKFSRQCKDAVSKANRMLDFINSNFSFKNKNITLPLYNSLVRPHLEYTVQFWSPPSYKGQSKIWSCSAKGYEDDNILKK